MKRHAERWEHVARAAHVSEPAVRTPRPVANDRVNEAGYADAIEQVADESSTADHRARGDCRAGIGECELENPDGEKCDAGTLIRVGGMLEKEPVVTDESIAVAEHERETDGIEQNAAEASIDHALDQHVDRFPRAAEASFQHREAHLHTE